MGSILCEHCPAACCRHVALPIDKPVNRRDYDDIRWYLMHQQISVFVEDGDWFVQFQTRCKNLEENNLCGIYETRPEICSEYKGQDCDYGGGSYGYDELFTHAKQLDDYYFRKTGKRLGDRAEPPKKRRRKTAKTRKTA